MKAWLLKAFDGLQAVELAEAPDPEPGPGEVLLRVRYAALNPADRFLSESRYPAKPALPHVLGRDGIGEVVAVGPGVSDHRPGDLRVILRSEIGVNRWGTFAQKVVAPADVLVAPPAGWSEEQAGSAALVYLTAWQALTQWGRLEPAVVLVTGASGGVGTAAVQLARALGHTVVALSRSERKREQLRAMGAAVVADPQEPDWRKGALAQLGDRRVDLVVENVGGALFQEVIHALGMHGRVSVVGSSAGTVPQFNPATLLFRRLRIGGVAVGTYSVRESHEAWQSVVDLLARTGQRPVVDSTWPFDQLPAAFDRLAEGPMGKVVVKVAEG